MLALALHPITAPGYQSTAMRLAPASPVTVPKQRQAALAQAPHPGEDGRDSMQDGQTGSQADRQTCGHVISV